MKTLESFFSRTAQFGLLIYLTGCFGLLIALGAAVAKWLKLIDVIQYIAFAFGLGLLTLLIGMVGLSLLGIRGIRMPHGKRGLPKRKPDSTKNMVL